MDRRLPLVLALLASCACRRPSTPATRERIASSRTAVRAGVTPVSTTAAQPAFRDLSDGVRVARAEVADDAGLLDWVVVRLDLARVTLRARAAPDDSVLALAADPNVLVAIDAGFFDDAHQPSGTLISAGTDLAGPRPHGGSGLLVVRDGVADVVDAAAPLAREGFIDLAVQCGPRLVERDGSCGIYRDDGQRYARTAACVRDGGRTLDLIATWVRAAPIRGPGLFALAQRLSGPSPVGDVRGCERALNLDGGPSTGIFVRGAPELTHPARGPVPFVLTVSAAPAAHGPSA